ncbi:hypothetical protein GCM10010862_03510 [Devosia nitrariae]|uniref:Uncharacterized protein n=1 Tax=Devosia nitrariae TaxID=2071872 RepID=A0ABQ5W067_9HYPH|nr:hypothetical protein GCM10010862_03510 [Devosia nitrariae]
MTSQSRQGIGFEFVQHKPEHVPIKNRGLPQDFQRVNKPAVDMLSTIPLHQARQALTVKDLIRVADGVNALEGVADTAFGNRFLNDRDMPFIE